jgi:beta-1,4-mannosyltransferase
VGFKCLDELVKDGVNGLVFHSSHQLAEQLLQLLAQFPDNQRLAQLRVGVRTHKVPTC